MNGSKLKRSLLLGGLVTTSLGSMGNNCGVSISAGPETCGEVCGSPMTHSRYERQSCGCDPDGAIPAEATPGDGGPPTARVLSVHDAHDPSDRAAAD